MSSCNKGEIIRALGRMASGAEERGHYSFSRLDAAWAREAIDMLCSDHEQLELRIADSAAAWDKCEERRQNEDRLTALIAELLDDPLIMEGAPPGVGWFDRAEAAIGRPIGSSFQKALAQKRKELSEIARATYAIPSHHSRGEK